MSFWQHCSSWFCYLSRLFSLEATVVLFSFKSQVLYGSSWLIFGMDSGESFLHLVLNSSLPVLVKHCSHWARSAWWPFPFTDKAETPFPTSNLVLWGLHGPLLRHWLTSSMHMSSPWFDWMFQSSDRASNGNNSNVAQHFDDHISLTMPHVGQHHWECQFP